MTTSPAVTTNTTNITLRASRADLAMKCGMSRHGMEGLKVDPYFPGGPQGSACHLCLAQYIRARKVGVETPTAEQLEEYCSYFDVSFEDIAIAYYTGVKLLERGSDDGQLPRIFDLIPLNSALVEHSLVFSIGNVTFTGTADLVRMDTDALVVLDWKSGWSEYSRTHQLNQYAYGLMAMASDMLVNSPIEVHVLQVNLRTGTYEHHTLTFSMLETWSEVVMTQLRNGADTYSPGPHCQFCPSNLTCQGRKAWVQSHVADLLPVLDRGDNPPMLPIQREQFPEFRNFLSRLESCIEVCRDMIKADLHCFGPVDLGDGRVLGLQEQNGKSVINGQKALPVVKEALGDAWASVVQFGKSSLVKAVRDAAGRGKMKVAEDKLLEDLRAAGAIYTPRIFKMCEFTPKKKEIESHVAE